MIKRTIFFSKPSYLSYNNGQMIIKQAEAENAVGFTNEDKQKLVASIPVEDIGVVLLEHPQITLTHVLLSALIENNTSVITCDSRRMPIGLMLPLEANYLQSERFSAQMQASEPLRKQLWQQTIKQKIINQSMLLKEIGLDITNMEHWARDVKSGDTENHEGRAAAFFWKEIFKGKIEGFIRDSDGDAPNNLLNYGYAILRAVIARSLVASGLLPTLGIHHHNRYNAYCLADDIMEPYRPFVDKIVLELVQKDQIGLELTKENKTCLLQIPVIDVIINGKMSPLMVATQQTSASLIKCFQGTSKKIVYPVFV